MRNRRSSWTDVSSVDRVVLYPSFGHLVDDGNVWRVHVRGTVYGQGSIGLRKRLLLGLLRKVMRVEPSASQHPLFEERIRDFIAPTEPGIRVGVQIGGRHFVLQNATRRNGRFTGIIRLHVDEISPLLESGTVANGWLEMAVVGENGTNGHREGRACLIQDQGISVVSDIDDTVKRTEVLRRRTLLENTFLREFEAIDGMAQVYRGWAANGAVFHYISLSPWQLYDSLAELMELAQFPPGTFHLQSFRLRDHMLRRLLLIRGRGKMRAMRSLLRIFPERRFVFVGDSGERDPEIYGLLARRFPRQVVSIYIRNLPERPLDGDRCRKAFRRVAPDRWQVFQIPTELPEGLPQHLSGHSLA